MLTKNIEILFSTPKKWSFLSGFLRWYLGAPFSHVCLKIRSDFYERTMIYEASAGQVQAEKYENWIKRNRIITQFSLEVDAKRKKEIIQFCIDHLRHKYGMASLFNIFLRDKLGINASIGADGHEKFICSEFAFLSLKPEIKEVAHKKGLTIIEEADFIDPTEIYEILS